MATVYEDETLRQIRAHLGELKDTLYEALDRETLKIIEELLDEYGQDANDWASESGYGYCDDCDGEQFRDESRD